MATAPDTSLSKQIQQLLTCCICDETLKEPRTLGCFHSFCKKCLGEYVESQRKKAKKGHEHPFDCPLCRTQFQLKQEESVDLIRPCFFINDLLEMFTLHERASQIRCDACKSNVHALIKCIECERYLCGNCLTAHNNWPDFNDHEVLTLEQLAKPENQNETKAKPRCNKKGHGNKPLEFYCNTCDKLACVSCILLDHPKPQHECEPIDVVASQEKELLKTTFNILRKKFDDGHNALENIKQASENLQTSSKRAKDIIVEQQNKILKEFAKKLQHTTAALIVDVDKKQNKINQKLVKQHDDMKVYIEKVNGSLEFVKNIIERGSNEDILSLRNEIKENASHIEKKCPKMMRPIHSGYFVYQQKISARNLIDNVDLKDLGRVAGEFAFPLYYRKLFEINCQMELNEIKCQIVSNCMCFGIIIFVNGKYFLNLSFDVITNDKPTETMFCDWFGVSIVITVFGRRNKERFLTTICNVTDLPPGYLNDEMNGLTFALTVPLSHSNLEPDK